MKKWIVLGLLVGLLVLIAGCTVPEETAYYETLTETVNAGIDAQQVSTDEIIAAVEESKLVSAEKLEKVKAVVTAVNDKTDVLQSAALEAAKVYDEKAGADPVGAAIEALQTANDASAPINPYAGLIGAVLGLAGAVYGVKKRADLKIADEVGAELGAKYTAHKRAAAKIMREGTVEEADKMYETIGTERKALGL